MNLFKVLNFGITWIKNKNNQKKIKVSWRNKNSHNYTTVPGYYPDIIDVGNHTYGCIDVRYFGNKDEHLTIGHYCSIAEGVVFLTGGNHSMKTLTQFPIDAYFGDSRNRTALTKGPIFVGDDVWIGTGATILSGVTIGQRAIIGAKSIVSKDVPPYAIFVGNKVVKHRYPENIVDKMVKFDFSKLTPEEIMENRSLFDVEIDESFFDTEFYKSHLKQ